MPELLLVAEVLATEEAGPLLEALLPEVAPLALVVSPELAVLGVLPLPVAFPPAPPAPAADSSIWDPFAQAEARTTHAAANANPVVHHARYLVLRRVRAMLMSP